MKPLLPAIICVFYTAGICAQRMVDRAQFFADTAIIQATLILNMGKLQAEKQKQGYRIPANFSCTLNGVVVNDEIALETRGHFRRGLCYMPPLKIIFNSNKKAALSPLKSLKLVSQCNADDMYKKYLLKEYLVYKMYNLISEKSFRVRLMNIQVVDSAGKRKPFSQMAFLMEDVKDMAKRNLCVEYKGNGLNAALTNRPQMTTVSIFEYMISNTDWSVPNRHNIALIRLKDSSIAPYAVPYDFDFSGMVSAIYAEPGEELDIKNVRQRYYLGFPRTMDELNLAIAVFKKQKDSIYSLVANFSRLLASSKKEMLGYLDGFYDVINKTAHIETEFINKARRE